MIIKFKFFFQKLKCLRMIFFFHSRIDNQHFSLSFRFEWIFVEAIFKNFERHFSMIEMPFEKFDCEQILKCIN